MGKCHDATHRSHRGNKDRGMEHDAIQWEGTTLAPTARPTYCTTAFPSRTSPKNQSYILN
jgi:hypothetical protein